MYLVGDEQLLIDRMSIRTPILVLGAGFSKGIQSQDGKPLPAGHELAEELFNEVLSKSKTVKKEDLEDYWAERSDLKKTCDNIEMEPSGAEGPLPAKALFGLPLLRRRFSYVPAGLPVAAYFYTEY